MNCLDQCRQFASREGVIGDERGHHFGGHFEGYRLGHVAESSPNSLVAPDYAYIRNSSRGRRHIIIVSGHVENCNDRQWASRSYATNQLRFEGYAVGAFTAPTSGARLCKRRRRQVNEPLPTVPAAPFSEGLIP